MTRAKIEAKKSPEKLVLWEDKQNWSIFSQIPQEEKREGTNQ